MIVWLVILGIACCGLAFACYILHQKSLRERDEHQRQQQLKECDHRYRMLQVKTNVDAIKESLSIKRNYNPINPDDLQWCEIRRLFDDIVPKIEDHKNAKNKLNQENRSLKRQVEMFRQEHWDLHGENYELRDENSVLKDEAAKNKEHKEQNDLLLNNCIQKQNSLMEANKRISQENISLGRRCYELESANGNLVTQVAQSNVKIHILSSSNKGLEAKLTEWQAKLREYQGPDNKELKRKLEEGEKRWKATQEQKSKVVEHNRKLKSALKKVEHENHRLKENNQQLEQHVHVGLVERSLIRGEVQFDGGGSQQTCVVCWNSPLNVMISPCNHVCLCKKCSPKVEDVCPICKAGIEDKINVFIS